MSVLKQISIPDHDTWTIAHVNELAAKKQLSPTVIRALFFYHKYQHLLEADGTLPGLIDMIKGLVNMVTELQSQVQDLSSKVENMKYITSDNEDGDGPEVDGDDILNMLEEM